METPLRKISWISELFSQFGAETTGILWTVFSSGLLQGRGARPILANGFKMGSNPSTPNFIKCPRQWVYSDTFLVSHLGPELATLHA